MGLPGAYRPAKGLVGGGPRPDGPQGGAPVCRPGVLGGGLAVSGQWPHKGRKLHLAVVCYMDAGLIQGHLCRPEGDRDVLPRGRHAASPTSCNLFPLNPTQPWSWCQNHQTRHTQSISCHLCSPGPSSPRGHPGCWDSPSPFLLKHKCVHPSPSPSYTKGGLQASSCHLLFSE